jgi:hypothetical protein
LVALTSTGCESPGACQEAIDHLAERLPDFGCNPFPADTARMRIIENCGDFGTWTIGAERRFRGKRR